jgi:hypothetical protein
VPNHLTDRCLRHNHLGRDVPAYLLQYRLATSWCASKKGILPMKLIARSPLGEDSERTVTLSVIQNGSPKGEPVLLENGLAVGSLRSVLAKYSIVEATPEERAALQAVGYFILDSEW